MQGTKVHPAVLFQETKLLLSCLWPQRRQKKKRHIKQNLWNSDNRVWDEIIMVPQRLLLKQKENFAVEIELKHSSAWYLYHCSCCWGKSQVLCRDQPNTTGWWAFAQILNRSFKRYELLTPRNGKTSSSLPLFIITLLIKERYFWARRWRKWMMIFTYLVKFNFSSSSFVVLKRGLLFYLLSIKQKVNGFSLGRKFSPAARRYIPGAHQGVTS